MSTKEALDLDSSRRKVSGPKAGFICDSRIMVDEEKFGSDVLATHGCADENTKNTCSSSSSSSTMSNAETEVDKKADIRPKQSPVGVSGKTKARKSESSVGSPSQITRQRSELRKNLDEKCEKLGVFSDGIKKSPVQIKKTRSVSSQKGIGDQTSVGNEISLVKLRKVKSESAKAFNDSKSELRKMNSEPSKSLDQPSDANLKNSLSLQLVRAKTVVPRKIFDENVKKSDDEKVADECNKDIEEPVRGNEESPVEIEESRSDENCKEFGVYQEKAITSNVGNEDQIQIITTPPNVDGVDSEEEEKVDKEVKVEVENKGLETKDTNISAQEQEPKKLVIEEKKLLSNNERSTTIPPITKKQAPPAVNHSRIRPTPTKTKPIPVSDHFYVTPSKLQSLADLIMWRDVSRSAFVFGIGAFAIISSSYTKDLNISFISVVSYLGLVYLGVSFMFRSLVSRGSVDVDDTSQEHVVGEEEAVWLIKLVLPYVNELLLKLRSLFSGDPATTMKLAVVLYILARCGGSITIWKMTKLGFFGVFMVPKLCSSYSSHFAAYGTFWIRRFGDAWESCSHKKAVGFGIFTLIWNLSSVIARVWAVFILFVAFKYYQQWYWIKQQPPCIAANSNSRPQSAPKATMKKQK